MGHHHNPFDPRNPLSPALYFTLVNGGNGRGEPPSQGGCGCVMMLIIFAVLIISSLTWR